MANIRELNQRQPDTFWDWINQMNRNLPHRPGASWGAAGGQDNTNAGEGPSQPAAAATGSDEKTRSQTLGVTPEHDDAPQDAPTPPEEIPGEGEEDEEDDDFEDPFAPIYDGDERAPPGYPSDGPHGFPFGHHPPPHGFPFGGPHHHQPPPPPPPPPADGTHPPPPPPHHHGGRRHHHGGPRGGGRGRGGLGGGRGARGGPGRGGFGRGGMWPPHGGHGGMPFFGGGGFGPFGDFYFGANKGRCGRGGRGGDWQGALRQFVESLRQQAGAGGSSKRDADEDGVDFEPAVDVYDAPAEFVVHVSLPGARRDDVAVTWDEAKSALTVAGVVTRDVDEPLAATLALDERDVGLFRRVVRLGDADHPAAVDADAIDARFEDGILKLRVPKTEAFVEVKKVEIK